MAAMENSERSSEVLEESKEAHRRPVGTAPAGVEALLADYIGAWENSDVDAFRSVVTDDFVAKEYVYQDVGESLNLVTTANFTVDEAATIIGQEAFQIEHVGEQIVVGDGPWYVSTQEIWPGPARTLDGIATYVIVADQDGALKIAGQYLVGLTRMND